MAYDGKPCSKCEADYMPFCICDYVGPLVNEIVTIGDRRWKIREAVSMKAAMNAIAHARVSGSVGAKDILTNVDRVTRVMADVVQINSDGTERQPYTEAY